MAFGVTTIPTPPKPPRLHLRYRPSERILSAYRPGGELFVTLGMVRPDEWLIAARCLCTDFNREREWLTR